MRIYTIIPISRGMGKETLTYFGADAIPLGALVSIPLRKKTAPAIVIESHLVPTNKEEIKSSKFSLKKIGKVMNPSFLTPEFLISADATAKHFATTTGAVLQVLIPKLVLESSSTISQSKFQHKSGLPKEHLVIQDTNLERFAQYKGVVRGEFARQSSVFFCLPTIEDLHRAQGLLEKGIEQYTVVLHSNLTKKEFKQAVEKIKNEGHPLLIIGTPPFLSLIRQDLGVIILDRENSRLYKTLSRPHLDFRTFVQIYAKKIGVKLILGDLVLSVETIWKQKHDEFAELFPLKFRMLSTAENLLIDMKLPKGKFQESFRILSPELDALIDKTKVENENLFIFCARKGLAPITVCGDCGQVVICEKCNAPVTLYQRKNENFFLCNKCGTESSASVRCSHCQSWKLKTLGIGLDTVAEEIKKRFPEVTLFRLDKDSVKTTKKAEEIMKKFRNSPGSILIGTELALTYITEPIENIAVSSIDALSAMPDFRINEKIFYLLTTMRAQAEKVFIIQTRNGNEKLFDQALKGNIIDFYRDEIEERERFNYPPFSIFVKFTIEGKRIAVEKEVERLTESFHEFEPTSFESNNASTRGNTLFHIIFRFKRVDWPITEFIKKIKILPPQILVRVDPENLL